jgi:AhpD family alkylhydroperoxidase
MAAPEPLVTASATSDRSPRLNLHDSAPESMEEMISFQEFIGARTFDASFLELVRTYVSQLSRCEYGIDRYTHRARGIGETEERLRLLPRWRQSALYSERECAAFTWAECLWQRASEIPDNEFQHVREWFTEEELVDLTLVIVETQAWNRLATTFRQPPALGRRTP